MTASSAILIGKGSADQILDLKYANRHGLIAGATGTGKTVTLQSLAESFSKAGVPVFMADVKGDLCGVAASGGGNAKVEERLKSLGITDFQYSSNPVVMWDLFGQKGHPIRTTVSEMGPLMLARLLELNETQEGVLNIAFSVADDQGLLLLDMDDLTAILNHITDNADELRATYGQISKTTVGTIHRSLLGLKSQGAEQFFGEPALNLEDLMRITPEGLGTINLLAADKLIASPKLYSTFLLWLLAELFEELPEVGDLEKPKLVFFFDEAHLLFEDTPKALVDKVEQVVRLIRSKGVGVYFVTQSPADIPGDILGQLGNRVQHALRAFTPKDQKAVKVAAETFRPNPAFDLSAVITELAVGEALVSTLEKGGVPSVTERTFIKPPLSRVGPLSDLERAGLTALSPLKGRYDAALNRESAFEILKGRAEQKAIDLSQAENQKVATSAGGGGGGGGSPWGAGSTTSARRPTSNRQGYGEAMVKSVVRTVGSQLGREIVRGILGGILRR